MSKHHVDPEVMKSLWDRVKDAIAHPVHLFVELGVKPDKRIKGETKKDAEIKVWMEVARTAFTEGVAMGYDMGCVVSGAPDPSVPDYSRNEAGRAATHPKVVSAIEEIDAAVFNGDTFDNADARGMLTSMLARWQRRLADTGATDATKDGE